MNSLDEMMGYLISTNQVDETFGLKPKCPICGEPLEKNNDPDYPYICPNCNKEFNESLTEYKEEYTKKYRRW